MRYGDIFHKVKAREMSHSISHSTSVISDLSILNTAAMAMHMLS